MPTMPGLGSGIDTDAMIEKLRQVELQPIKKLKAEQVELDFQNQALQELTSRTLRLQKALKELYSFDSPFEKKIVYSDPKGYIEGVANNTASAGEYQIEVVRLATSLKFHSRSVEKNEELPKTSVTINETTEFFPGGSIDDFKAFLNENFKKLLTAKTIVKRGGAKIIVIESLKEGEAGMLQLSDSAGMLRQIELIGEGGAPEKPKPSDKPVEKPAPEPRQESEVVAFDLTRLSVMEEGPASIESGGRSLLMSDKGRRRLELGLPEITDPNKKVKEVRLKVAHNQPQAAEEDSGPFKIHEGPVDQLNIKGIELNSYNIERLRPEPETEPEEFDFGVALPGGKDRSLSSSDGVVTIPLNDLPEYLDFYTDNAEVTFSSVEVVYEVTPEPEEQEPEKTPDVAENEAQDDDPATQQRKLFPHLIDPAQDALVKLDGVEVAREGNSKLTDIIEGATLELKHTTEEPITVYIEGDTENSLAKMHEFVEAYNDLLTLVREVSKVSTEADAEEFEKTKEEAGLLASNSTVRLMINGLRRRMSDAYPSYREPDIRILSTIGVEPYDRNDDPEMAMAGYLQLNEDRFLEVLREHPQAVREFFGVDSNGDNYLDNGIGFVTYEYLRAYTRPSNGLIGNQIKANKSRIKDLAKEIVKKEEHVEHYVQGLKKKFGYMESTIREQKATEQYLKQRFRQSDK